MKLSELDPSEVTKLAANDSAPSESLKLSDLHPDEVQKVEPSLGQKAKKLFEDTVVDQLPALGAVAGGTVGGALGSVPGGLAGAGVGGYTGKAAQNLYNSLVRPEMAPKESSDYLTEPLKSGAEGVAGEALGQGAGAIIGKGVEALSPVRNKVASYLADKAEKSAFKASGPMLRDYRQAVASGKVNALGREALDSGVVTPLATHADVAERASQAASKKGAEIGDILKDLEASQAKLNGSDVPGLVPGGSSPIRSGVDRKAIAKSLRDDLISKNTDIPGIAAKNDKIEGLIQEFENGGDPLIGLSNAEAKKRAVGNEINWDRLPGADIPTEEQVQRSLYSKLKSGVESGADALEKQVGGPSASRFKDTKTSYGNLKELADIANDRASRDAANRAFGITDTGAAGAGGMIGSQLKHSIPGAAIGAAAGGAVNKFGRSYANSLKATGFDAVAKALASSPQGSAYIPVLEAAQNRGPQAFQTALRILSQKPEFQSALQGGNK